MPFIRVKDENPEMQSVSIKFEKPVLDDLDRYQKLTNMETRSATINEILRTVFAGDAEFLASKPNGLGEKKKKAKGSKPFSGDGDEAIPVDGEEAVLVDR